MFTKFQTFLVKEHIITLECLEEAERKAQSERRSIEDYLISAGYIDEEKLIEKIGQIIDIDIIDFDSIVLNDSAIGLLTSEMAKKHYIIPFDIKDEVLYIAISDPFNFTVIDEIKFITKKDVRPHYARLSQIKQVIELFYNNEAREMALEDLKREKGINLLKEEFSEANAKVDNAPVVRLVNSIINQAINLKASDIHIEPFNSEVIVRFRIDGMLKDITTIPGENYPPICTRLKIISKMDITEKRIPQDGKINMKFNGKDYDFRVSSLPTLYGEKIVLRILYKSESLSTLEHLGFNGSVIEEIKSILKMAHGMVLVSGPTGSGKTTTLYSMLKEINSREKNIITIEDPVEYSIKGINQVNINNKTGLTFASGLRSILRQDPNVIMIGEIRDEETAQIAVRAAITGHLVLSTIHTSDAVSSILRLADMGVPRYLVSNALAASIAQRLVRKICSSCKSEYYPDEREQGLLQIDKGQKLFRGLGCVRCGNTGYQGRTVAFELLKINSEYKELLMSDIGMDELKKQILKEGVSTMMDSCRDLMLQGITTSEEYLRLFQIV